MFKVMIIDDETILRTGIKNIINWKQFDCKICAKLQMVKKVQL